MPKPFGDLYHVSLYVLADPRADLMVVEFGVINLLFIFFFEVTL